MTQSIILKPNHPQDHASHLMCVFFSPCKNVQVSLVFILERTLKLGDSMTCLKSHASSSEARIYTPNGPRVPWDLYLPIPHSHLLACSPFRVNNHIFFNLNHGPYKQIINNRLSVSGLFPSSPCSLNLPSTQHLKHHAVKHIRTL
jgi:hypothetical protein